MSDTPDALPAFTDLPDLAGEEVGGAALLCNDEFFAEKENLLKPAAAVWKDHLYTDRGKWMDGWESRRRRTPGFDWCVVRLGAPGRVRGVVVDTSFFRGNFPEGCSLDACAAPPNADVETLTGESIEWAELLPQSKLDGDSQNEFSVTSDERVTHLRFRIYPDGGVARLRVYGEVAPDWDSIRRAGGLVDLAAVENGGLVVATSDEFFGHRHNLIMPGRALDMSDGWETKRRRGPGHDWCVIQLGARGTIRRVEVDTAHFKGNFPESCSLEVCKWTEGRLTPAESFKGADWRELLPRTKLQAHTRHFYEAELRDAGEATHVRFRIYPDGGVSRLRLYSTPSDDA
jgi:allantoicase